MLYSNDCFVVVMMASYIHAIFLCRWFSQGAVDIYQCFSIDISYTHFEHNGPVFITKKNYKYRGHAGGLSIGFDNSSYGNLDQLPDDVGVAIDNCTFFNNTSDLSRSDQVSTDDFVSNGRGGAVTISINSTFEFNVSITDCHVQDNFARSFCGGIFLVFSGYSPHTSTVNNTVFINNISPGLGSGGLSLGYVEGSVNGEKVRLDVFNSEFVNNSAKFGGGIYLYADSESIAVSCFLIPP